MTISEIIKAEFAVGLKLRVFLNLSLAPKGKWRSSSITTYETKNTIDIKEIEIVGVEIVEYDQRALSGITIYFREGSLLVPYLDRPQDEIFIDFVDEFTIV